MEPVLSQKFDKLQASYARLKNHLDPLDNSLLNQSPAPGKWSPIQIVHHLHLSESLSLQYLNKKIGSGPLPKTGLKEAFGMALLKFALASPLKFKAPVKVGTNFPDYIEKNELLATYDATRESMQKTLQSFPASRGREAVYKHPKVGYLNIHQFLEFLQDHFTHHDKQIRALTKN